jgi:hypothetical protein
MITCQVLLAAALLLGDASAPVKPVRSIEPRKNPPLGIYYSPFALSCWGSLRTFRANALCKVELGANEPASRRIWDLVSTARGMENSSVAFDGQIVRLWTHRKAKVKMKNPAPRALPCPRHEVGGPKHDLGSDCHEDGV